MRFSCLTDYMLKGLQRVQKAVPTRPIMPHLSGILLEAHGDLLRMKATDLDMWAETSVPAEVEEEGEIVLDAHYLQEIVRRLPDGMVSVKMDGGTAMLQSGRAKYEIRALGAEEYPELPHLEFINTWEVSQKELRRMIQEVSFAASNDYTRPALTGVLLEVEGGIVAMAATNASRLAVSTRGTLPGGDGVRVLIPARSLEEVVRNLDEEAEAPAMVSWNQNYVQFNIPGFTLTSRLIDMLFPNYHQVIPSEFQTKVQVSRKEFLEAIARASIFKTEDKISVVHLEAHAGVGTVIISAGDEIGRAEEEVSCARVDGEPLKVLFNSRYLTDVLKVLECEEVELRLTSITSPAVISPVGDVAYQYIVMPIKLT